MSTKTDLGRCVEVLLQVFGALTGFALVRFITTPPLPITTLPNPIQYSEDLWWLVAAFTALLLRYMLGSAIHLNREFGGESKENKNPGGVTLGLFIKDMIFLVGFGGVAVWVTLAKDVEDFIWASKIFVTLGIIWCVVDYLLRTIFCSPRVFPWKHTLSIFWTAIDGAQLIFLWNIAAIVPDIMTTAQVLAIGFSIFLIFDVSLLICGRILPKTFWPIEG